ncbi:ABC transporter permease [Paenibacillus mucilaginosus]|uniref:Binding-protein-dependent transport systems inner membrane component n=3 Tax=Paenibacillus mucilaginosus TaxID=61624 RepID=H6NAD4_9BACL|nr:ABC transporter permease subunit [Paenibacillus mucilaginosus]AEI40779.1 binding-protein-dependent transport systems inner membrane component [Paenibacillus mucilaginosus KNP414]AFC29380.1 binding-protein-dependent transport systems inner membrane component [Paenibacillus mucilaginosus 3016]AFH61560.1 sugar ABC transporter permease [Paenibacillus mucilaginosus K02]MCG7211744.1 ABC transporter permease subunit [Paenibacillus mucilaginosus]WDM29902.1 sugar ABC transporter permease [Paenibacil
MNANLKGFVRNIPLHLMLVPGLIVILIYNYIPMAGLIIAFQDFSPIGGFRVMNWVGLDNFKYLFELPGFYQVVWNTVFISVMKIIAGLTVPVLVALLLNEVRSSGFKRSVQTIIYMPHFFSWVVLAGILIDVLSPSGGLVNMALKAAGYPPIQFLASNDWFPYVLVISDQWKEFGFGTIIYLAALTSIDSSLYEAAVMDGAGRWKQTWHITLPGIRPIMILMLTLSLGNVLNGGFDQVFNLYNPLVYESGDILDTMIYRIGLQDAQYSVSTALGLIKSVVSFLFIGLGYYLAYRIANYRIF